MSKSFVIRWTWEPCAWDGSMFVGAYRVRGASPQQQAALLRYLRAGGK